MTIYDQVSTHWERLPGDVPRKAAGTHIGIFLAWCLARGLGSPMHERQHTDALAKLQRRWFTGRDYLLEALDGVLAEEHLGDEGDAFATAYYVSGTYLRDYEEHLLGHSPTLYHVRDEWGTYDVLEPVLDARLERWRRAGASAPAPEVAPPPSVREPQPPPPRPPPPPKPPPSPASPPLPISSTRPAPPAPGTKGDEVARKRSRPVIAPRRTKRAWRTKPGKGGIFFLIFAVVAVLGWVWIKSEASRQRSRRSTRPSFDRFRSERERQVREMLERARRKRSPRSPFRAPVPPPVRPPERVRQPKWPPLTKTQTAAAVALGVPPRLENSLGMRFVLIPAGGFVMGSPPSEQGRHAGEEAHNVVLSRAYYMQVAEVSNALFRRFSSNHFSPSPPGLPSFNLATQPATSIDHESAVAFGAWVDQRDAQHHYRLPTEAEWEYACRAGAGTRFWWGDSERDAGHHANVADLSAKSRWPVSARRRVEAEEGWRWFETTDGQPVPAPVAHYPANPWGLYDMLGNVHEWCADWAGPYGHEVVEDPRGPTLGSHRILRGGAFDTPVWMTRCAYRGGLEPDSSQVNLGFRLVAELPGR